MLQNKEYTDEAAENVHFEANHLFKMLILCCAQRHSTWSFNVALELLKSYVRPRRYSVLYRKPGSPDSGGQTAFFGLGSQVPLS
jgi:hypothetical protein